MGDAFRGHLRQGLVQRHGFGRGVQAGRGKGALDAGGADVDGVVAQGLPNLAGEAGDGGFAIGAGDRDHAIGLGAKVEGSGLGQRGGGVFDHDEGGNRPMGRDGCGHGIGTVAVGQHRCRAHPQGILREIGPVDLGARQSREQPAAGHLAAVERHARHLNIAAGLRGQAQIRQFFLGHGPQPPLPLLGV